jgi:hypothetical protein
LCGVVWRCVVIVSSKIKVKSKREKINNMSHQNESQKCLKKWFNAGILVFGCQTL